MTYKPFDEPSNWKQREMKRIPKATLVELLNSRFTIATSKYTEVGREAKTCLILIHLWVFLVVNLPSTDMQFTHKEKIPFRILRKYEIIK